MPTPRAVVVRRRVVKALRVVREAAITDPMPVEAAGAVGKVAGEAAGEAEAPAGEAVKGTTMPRGDEIIINSNKVVARTRTAKVVLGAALVEAEGIKTTTTMVTVADTTPVTLHSTHRTTPDFTWRAAGEAEAEARTCTTNPNTWRRCNTTRRRVKCPNANKFSPR